MLEATASTLAVDSDRLLIALEFQRRHPTPDHRFQFGWIQPRKDAGEGVVRGNATRQREDLHQPRLANFAELGNIIPPVASAHHGEDGHHDHLGQRMHAIVSPRIADFTNEAQNGGGC